MTEDDEAIEHTLTQIAQAHLYSLPPGPRPAGGYRCQDWPKSSHIFTGRVRVVATGPKCTIRIEDKEKGTLFAMCPLSNDNLETSVEPVSDSSRYFVLRVADVTTGRHAFIGMGFVDRNEAFDFNVTLQDHIKHVRYEAEAAKREAEPAPTGPAKDWSLKGSVSVALPAGAAKPARERPVAGAPMGGMLLPPPPPGGGGGGRRAAAAAAPAAPAAPAAAAPSGEDPFGSSGGDWATFG